MHGWPRRTRRGAALVLAPVLVAGAACAEGPGPGGEAAGPGYADGEPVTVENCGHELSFDTPPERVMLLETAPVTTLEGLGVLDRVVARAGTFTDEYYEPDLASRIADIPSLSDDLDASGHLVLSQEEVVAHSPDLALGLPDGMTRPGLADAGVTVLEQEIYCPEPTAPARFDTLYEEVERYGRIFDREDEAAGVVSDLRNRVQAVESAAEAEPQERSAAVLYPSVGGGPVYAYGAGSMAQPQLEALGVENVFGDSDERVFEVQTEELVHRDPAVLILLYQGDPAGVEEAVTSLPGAENIRAVHDGELVVQLFNFTEPASPLVVDGLERLAEEIHE